MNPRNMPITVNTSNDFMWITTFILASFRATVFWRVFYVVFQWEWLLWLELAIWTVLLLMMIRSLRADGSTADFAKFWKQNWFLVVFVGVALLSVTWSVAPVITIYRGLVLLSVSLIGSFLGLGTSNRNFVHQLYRFGAFLLVVCFATVIVVPPLGTMLNEPYNGAWRGVFWHKNHLGTVMALFNFVYFLCVLEKIQARTWRTMPLDVALYVCSLIVVYYSRSAAGLVLVILLNTLSIIAYVWIRLSAYLRVWHYYAVSAFSAMGAILIFLNRNFVFGLFDRNATMTGRIPLWYFLIGEVIGRSPWIGYGFGAVWSIEAFRVGLHKHLGWEYPIVIADNGFLDILLHIGLAGFIPFLAVLIAAFTYSLRFALQHRTILDFFALLFVLYAVFANVSFSLFLETEAFVWLILISVLSLTTPRLQRDEASIS